MFIYSDLGIADIFGFNTGKLLTNPNPSFSLFHLLRRLDVYVFLPDTTRPAYFGNYANGIFVGNMNFLNLTTNEIVVVDIKRIEKEWEYFTPLLARQRELIELVDSLEILKREFGFLTHTGILLPLDGSQFNFNLINLIPKVTNVNDGIVFKKDGTQEVIANSERQQMFIEYGQARTDLDVLEADIVTTIENAVDFSSLQVIEDNFQVTFFDVIGDC